MIKRFIHILILVFLPFLIYAEESQLTLVAIQQNGNRQIYNIDDHPCLTISNVNGNLTFNIKDKHNITVSDVRTCVFSIMETTEHESEITSNVDNQTIKKYIENGVLYIEHNGNIYNATGQRIK